MSRKNDRSRANILTMAVNELLAKDLITLEYDETNYDTFDTFTYEMNIDNMLCMIEYRNIFKGQLYIIVTILPQEDVNLNLVDRKCCIWTRGYLERKSGKYIQSTKCNSYHNYHKMRLTSKKPKDIINKMQLRMIKEKFEKENVIPNGFEKQGKFII